MFIIHPIKTLDGNMVKYRVSVVEAEDTIIWEFEHREEQGMSTCLRRAADAIEFCDPVQMTRKS